MRHLLVTALTIGSLYAQPVAKGLQDQVSFVSIHVFGRTMESRVPAGRDHNGEHHATILFDKNVKGGVVGGVSKTSSGYAAAAIDSTTGQASTGGDVPQTKSLAAMGKTLCAALGLSSSQVDGNITGGKAVAAALQA